MKAQNALAVLVCLLVSTSEGQVLLSPRAVALGGYEALVTDVRGFAANPAGLTVMKDWDFQTTTFIPTSALGSGFVFNGFSMGKRLSGDDAIAFQYSPGTLQEFLSPSAERINGQTISTARKISYQEPVTFGLAHSLSGQFAAGIGVRMRTTAINDPQFQFQLKDSTIIPIPITTQLTTWLVDPALLWKPSPELTFSAVGRGLFRFDKGSFPQEFGSYKLPGARALELGGAADVAGDLRICGYASTDSRGAIGAEWQPGLNISLRGGAYFDRTSTKFVDAVAVGGGWTYRFLDFDAAYLRFTDQSKRVGSASVGALDASLIKDVSMNPFTTDRLMFSVKAFFGLMREPAVRIESVEMTAGVFPAGAQTFAYRPLGTVRVRSLAGKPLTVKASFFVERFMDVPTETPPVYLSPGEVVELPLTAVFNDLVKSVTSPKVCEGDVRVSAVAMEDADDHVQARFLIHGRNDWDGDILTLRYFLTPNDPDVIRYSRDILLSLRDSLSAVPQGLEQFQKAKLIFNAFAGKLMYVNDPKLTADYVQYPSETLSLRGGDCDDMSVCFVSLLASIGISSAFVDVVPPDHPENSHVYLMFDTGLSPKYAKALSGNPKRYVIRTNSTGAETIWIPIETTVITKGFAEAWSIGAEEHFQHSEVDLGLIKGWVRIVDVN